MAQDRLRRGYFPSATIWEKGKGKSKGKPSWQGKSGNYPSKSCYGKGKPWQDKGKGGMGKQSRLQQIMARTKCNKCGVVGHWHRECPQNRLPSSAPPSASGVQRNMASFFICRAQEEETQASVFW
eukprot:4172525-Amphidinium_carterae.1